jgi:DNA-binding LytR/AlgR family response regulator
MYTEYKVLIVDDEPSARRGIRVRLRAYSDFSIVADCENGVTALEAIRRHAPDLVFLDVRTQGMNAFEMLKRLPANRQPFLIFHTVNDQLRPLVSFRTPHVTFPADKNSSRHILSIEQHESLSDIDVKKIHMKKILIQYGL